MSRGEEATQETWEVLYLCQIAHMSGHVWDLMVPVASGNQHFIPSGPSLHCDSDHNPSPLLNPSHS
jgi:hypothetical protein